MYDNVMRYLKLMLWVMVLVSVGSGIGYLTQGGIDQWYSGLLKSSLTPPNYMFGIVWSVLYVLIAAAGWLIWEKEHTVDLTLIKRLYIIQLLLNFSWTPLFFNYHLIGLSLLCLLIILVLVATLLGLSYRVLKSVAYLLTPYLLWLFLAGYLNLYIWLYN